MCLCVCVCVVGLVAYEFVANFITACKPKVPVIGMYANELGRVESKGKLVRP